MPPMDTNSNNMDGSLSRKCFQYLAERARGGVGLIIMEAVSVDWPEGKISDPFWPVKAEEGREDEIRSCLNCDEGCLHQFYNIHSNIRCVLNPYVGFEDFYRESDRYEAANKKIY
jgi:2,4-dienoyl-CoA reductase-like NADH-dependent reductase (Old Yellow Enzyme family)